MDRRGWVDSRRRRAVRHLVLEVGVLDQTAAPDSPDRIGDGLSETVDVLLVQWGRGGM